MKKVFTTGQVAKICKVAPRTVSKWFDSGRLRGYRIPGSQDRRIPREQLIRFLKEHGMPLGELEDEEWHKVLLIGTEKLFNDRIKEILPEDDDFKFELANSGFEAGILAGSFHPDTIVIALGLGRAESIQIVSNLRKDDKARWPCPPFGFRASDSASEFAAEGGSVVVAALRFLLRRRVVIEIERVVTRRLRFGLLRWRRF